MQLPLLKLQNPQNFPVGQPNGNGQSDQENPSNHLVNLQSRKNANPFSSSSHSPMPPHSLPSVFAAVLLLTAAHSRPAASHNCELPFSCGDGITNATYPFSVGFRHSHCGPPGFALTCRRNATVLIQNSVTYRVLQLDQARKTLTLSRPDIYSKNGCPTRFHNTSLNPDHFSYDWPLNDVVNLFYGCNLSAATAIMPHNLFTCKSGDAYYLVGAGPDDQPYRAINEKCSVRISAPILRAAGYKLRAYRISLKEALMQGFVVKYSVPHESMCSWCTKLGGQCGFDSVSSQPICVCRRGPCPFVLTLPPVSSPNARRPFQGNNSSNLAMHIGLPICGAVLVGVGLGWLHFHCRQRRKHILQHRVSEPACEEITAPSNNFTKNYNLSFTPANSDLIGQSTYFGTQVFSYAELEEATDKFNSSRVLGDGGYGVVYYGVLFDGRLVAVKRLHENNFKRVEQFMNEVEILTLLRHANLVTLYGCTSKRSHELLLVYEYVSNGTLADHLHGKRAEPGLLSWPIRLNIAIETADALDYLHKSDIIHRDVKTNNILLDNDFHVKVADFGISRLFPNDVTHVSTAPQGTPGYVDPEYYQCFQLTEKSDVYSFGVVLVELLSSLQAVDTNRHRHNINLASMATDKIQNHTLHELVDSSLGFETDSSVRRMATLVAELAFECLQRERDLRPSMEEVLEGLRCIQNGQNVEIVNILPDGDVAPREGEHCSAVAGYVSH